MQTTTQMTTNQNLVTNEGNGIVNTEGSTLGCPKTNFMPQFG